MVRQPIGYASRNVLTDPRLHAGANAPSHCFYFCLSVIAVLFGVTAFAGPATAVSEGRDWVQYPPVAVLPMPKDLYALGDAHGDFDRVAELLAGAKLIERVPQRPEEVKWNGGEAVLVCTGDLIDKYTENLAVIALMRAIGPQAEAAGGRVIVTMGNHEAEFLAGGARDRKASDFEKELRVAGLAVADVAAGRDHAGIGAWMRDLPVAAKVGDWFFCHAGNTQGRTLAQLADETEKEVDADGFRANVLLNPDSLLEARMHPRPWWEWDGTEPRLKDVTTTRKKERLDSAAAETSEKRLRHCIEAVGCEHLVFGHQPGTVRLSNGVVRKAGDMFSAYDGLCYLIDTGMSRGVDGGRGAVLWIHTGTRHQEVKVIHADGKEAEAER